MSSRADYIETRVVFAWHGEGMPRGKTENFSPEQANVLMQIAKQVRKDRGWSQTQLGDALGIGQQSAGRIERIGGANYTNASKLVKLGGYPNLDAAFAAFGVDQEVQLIDDPWPNRRDAARYALARGVPEHIVQAVRDRFDDPRFRDRTVSWWGLQFQKAYVAELEQQEEFRDVLEAKAKKDDDPAERPSEVQRKGRKAG